MSMQESAPDTSRDAVERLAGEREEKAAESFMMASAMRDADMEPTGWMLAGEYAFNTAATLRALLAERDAAKAQLATLQSAAAKAVDGLSEYQQSLPARLGQVSERFAAMEAERDAARAEVARLREALLDYSAVITMAGEGAFVDHRYLCDSTLHELNIANAALAEPTP
jgi:hypothetical protein